MSQTPIIRILDASLNRASEGLRVVEDYVRFVLDDRFLTARTKAIRHELAAAATAISSLDRQAARDTQQDVGTSISTAAEGYRRDAWDVCAASLKRAEQSLRSLEEYGKLVDSEFAGRMETLRYELYTMEKAIEVGRSSRDRLQTVRLCVLVSGRDTLLQFEQLVGELVEAGVGMIQLRDKLLNDRELIARARSLVMLTRPKPPAPPGVSPSTRRTQRQPPAEPGAICGIGIGTLAVINDRADIAAAAEADGVHVGQEDLSVKDAREIVGPRMLIGVSTHNIEQARTAVLDGANYLGAGPTFVSSTKSFGQFAGLDYLRQIAEEISLPTFAIGGITAQNLPDVLSVGISKVAVSAAVTQSSKPSAMVNELLRILNETSTRQVEFSV